MSKNSIKHKGSVLAFVLVIVFVVSLIIFSLAALTSQNLTNVSSKYWEERARFGALAGVQRALTELDNDETWDAGFHQEQLEGDPEITYSVQVLNRLDQDGQYAPDGKTWVPEDSVWIHSVASLAFRRSAGVSSLVSIVGPQRPVFNHALFAVNEITLDNSQTLAWHPGGMGDGFAWVGTSSTEDDAIKLRNNSFVDGDVVTGVEPDGTTPFSMDGTSSIFGTEKSSEEAILVTGFVSPIPPRLAPPSGPGTYVTINGLPPVVPPPGYPSGASGSMVSGWQRITLQPRDGTNNGQYGSIDLEGNQELYLDQPGNYLIQGTLDLRDGARITVNPANISGGEPAVIYLDDALILLDGPNGRPQVNWDETTNQPGEPRALQIYDTERTDDVLPAPPGLPDGTVDNPAASIIRGTDQVSMIYGGKNLQLYMHDATTYGAVIADRILAENSIIFYDVRNRGVKMDGRGEITVMSSTIESAGDASAAVASDTTTNPAAPLPPDPPPATTSPPPPPPPGGPNPPEPDPPSHTPTYPYPIADQGPPPDQRPPGAPPLDQPPDSIP